MSRRTVFLNLAAAGGYIGIGLLLGYVLSDRTNNSALWLGIVLAVLGAVLLGMAISTVRTAVNKDERPVSSSGNIPDLPSKQ